MAAEQSSGTLVRQSSLAEKNDAGQRSSFLAGPFGVPAWLWALGVLLVLGVLYFALARPIQVLPQIAYVPPFELTDQRGEPFRLLEREGRTTLYSFAATRDAERLEQVSTLLSHAWEAFETEGWSEAIDVVLITVDPQHDDPAAWRGALDEWGLAKEQVSALTGSEMAVKLTVGTGFGVYYEPPQEDGGQVAFRYDPRMTLVDRTGLIRAEYDLSRLDVDRLVRDLTLLFNEEKAEGVTEWVYSAAHLFMCYPR